MTQIPQKNSRINQYRGRLGFILLLVALSVLLFFHPGQGETSGDESSQVEITSVESDSGLHSAGEENEVSESVPHPESPVSRVLISLIIIMLAAKLGGDLLERIGQPSVLGELIFGMVIGNLTLFGFHGLEYLKSDLIVEILAEIGVILLLFQVGLESKMEEMMSVGLSSFLVALFGVIAPFVLGFLVSTVFLPQESDYVHIYIGAVLCATSVGITARVLQDLGKLKTKEAKIILGAAVIDDILGLVVLAVVVGIIRAANVGGSLNPLSVLFIILKAVLFFAGALIIGVKVSPKLFQIASFLRVKGMLLTTALAVCFLLAYLADKIGLAPIVGAFAAGLIMEPIHYKEFTSRGEGHLEELLAPIALFLVPIFFVRMGLNVNLAVFSKITILGFAFALTFAAIIGKQVCAFGVREKGLDKISVGVGMIPRGEVGLIVADIGRRMMLGNERVINEDTFSAAVIMVMITTMITPPVLKWTLARGERRKLLHQETLVFSKNPADPKNPKSS